MGALIASPEAGDASANVMQQMKKCRAVSGGDRSKSFVPTMSANYAIDQSTPIPASNSDCLSIMNEDLYSQMMLIENGVIRESSDSTLQMNNCRFPYYRSSKSSGRFPDAVLVKDIGVSCTLLNENANNHNMSISGIESYLVKQLKREYNDLSNITSKITAYTKDILNNLSLKDKRKNRTSRKFVSDTKRVSVAHMNASSKHAMASQYMDDKGNLCLKLRLFTDSGTQYSPRKIGKESNNTSLQRRCVPEKVHSKHSNKQIQSREQTITQKENTRRHEKQVQTIFSKERMEMVLNAPKCSTSSIYDYLMMRKKKSSSETLKCALTKFDCAERDRSLYKKCDDNKDHKENLKSYQPVIFTNWREISRLKGSKNKTSAVSDESRQMVIEKHTYRDKSINPLLQGTFLSYYDTNSHVRDTKLHTVNIQIVKHKRRYV